MSLPDPALATDPATAGEAIAAEIAAGNEAASAQAVDSLKSAVDTLVEKIKAGAARIDEATVAQPRQAAPPVAPAPVFTPETLASLCEAKGLPKEAADVFVEFAKNVVLPVYSSQITNEAKRAKRDAERDATPIYDGGPTLGSLLKKYGPAVDALIKERGVTDAYLAEHGYSDLVRLAANNDPAFFEDRVKAEVARRAPAQPTAPAAAAPAGPTVPPARPPVEGVAAPSAAAAPRAAKSRDEAIALVPTTREEEDWHRTMFNMTPTDLKRQRYEIAEQERELGPIGLKQVGGMPICRLEDIFGSAVQERK